MLHLKYNQSVKDIPNDKEFYYCYRGFKCDKNIGLGWVSEEKFPQILNDRLMTDWYYEIRNLKTDKDSEDKYFFQIFNEDGESEGDFRVEKDVFDNNMVPPYNKPLNTTEKMYYKVGRNEKCCCGSGVKYKKCCLIGGLN